MMWDLGIGTGMWGGGLGMFLVGFFGLLVLAGFFLVLVWLVRNTGQSHGTGQSDSSLPGGSDPATSAARERYARGEISKEELAEILRTLQG
jgi:uncharacterized membrane protein